MILCNGYRTSPSSITESETVNILLKRGATLQDRETHNGIDTASDIVTIKVTVRQGIFLCTFLRERESNVEREKRNQLSFNQSTVHTYLELESIKMTISSLSFNFSSFTIYRLQTLQELHSESTGKKSVNLVECKREAQLKPSMKPDYMSSDESISPPSSDSDHPLPSVTSQKRLLKHTVSWRSTELEDYTEL